MKVRGPVSPSPPANSHKTTVLHQLLFLMEEQTLPLILISPLILPANYINLAPKLKAIGADTTFRTLTRFTCVTCFIYLRQSIKMFKKCCVL